MSRQILNAGLIGYGMIGKVHAYSTAVLPWYAPDAPIAGKIVAVATSRMETARAAREQIGCEFAFDDFRKITENPNIDVVHVCVPNASHFEMLVSAIRAGKHVYCEKPIVASAEEARELRRVLNETKYARANLVAHHLRGFAPLRRAKELIDAGRLGQIVRYRASYQHSSMLDPSGVARWKNGVGGGTIFDLGSHLVDLIDWLIGLPAEALAQCQTLVGSRPEQRPANCPQDFEAAKKRVLAEDSAIVMTRGLKNPARLVPKLPGDKIWEDPENAGADPDVMPLAVADPRKRAAVAGIIEATKLACGSEDELTLEIGGTRGALKFSLMNPHVLEFFDATTPYGAYGGDAGWKSIPSGGRYPAPESDFPSPKSTAGWLRGHVASLAAFYRGIADGQVYGADFRQALRTQDALDAIARSAESKLWTEL